MNEDSQNKYNDFIQTLIFSNEVSSNINEYGFSLYTDENMLKTKEFNENQMKFWLQINTFYESLNEKNKKQLSEVFGHFFMLGIERCLLQFTHSELIIANQISEKIVEPIHAINEDYVEDFGRYFKTIESYTLDE